MSKYPDLSGQNKNPDAIEWLKWFLFFGSVFFFMANLFASLSIYPSYSLSIGSSPFQAGLQNTLFSLTAVLIRFYLGPVIDQKGAKPLMLLGAFTFTTAPLLLLVSPTYGMLIAARIYQSVGLAVYLPGMYALTAQMAPPEKIGTYLGALRVFFNLGLFAGPAASLLLLDRAEYTSWFLLCSFTSLLAFLLLSTIKAPPVVLATKKAAGSLTSYLKALSVKQVYPILGGIAIFSFTYSAAVSFSAVYIDLIKPNGEAALFFAVFGASGIAACLGVGALSDYFGRQKTAWPMLIITGIGIGLLYFLPELPYLLLVCAVTLGIGIQGSSLVFAAWLIEISKPELRATTISLQENSLDIFFALGALTFGLAAQGPGLGLAFLLTGVITIIAVFPLGRLSAYLIKNSS